MEKKDEPKFVSVYAPLIAAMPVLALVSSIFLPFTAAGLLACIGVSAVVTWTLWVAQTRVLAGVLGLCVVMAVVAFVDVLH